MREQVLDVFLAQSNRLIDHAKGFPAVKKTYMANTVAIMIVLADERWTAAFPAATSPEWEAEYRANNERILLASIGAVVQNIQLAVTAHRPRFGVALGRRRGHDQRRAARAARLSRLLPRRSAPFRSAYRRRTSPRVIAGRIGQMVHWNRYETDKARSAGDGRPLRVGAARLRHVPRRRGHQDCGRTPTSGSGRGVRHSLATGRASGGAEATTQFVHECVKAIARLPTSTRSRDGTPPCGRARSRPAAVASTCRCRSRSGSADGRGSPAGTLAGSATSPCRMMRSERRRGSGVGTAESSASV